MIQNNTHNACVYFHRNPITNEIFYVGIGSKKRPYTKHGRSPYWNNYVRKNGNPIIEIYKKNLDLVEAAHLECHLIKVFGRRKEKGRTNGLLVNLSSGGTKGGAGVVASKSTRRKQSLKRKGVKFGPYSEERRSNISKSLKGLRKGIKFSESHKKKLSENLFNSKQKTAKRVIHISSGKIYNSSRDAWGTTEFSLNYFKGMMAGTERNRSGFMYLDKYNKLRESGEDIYENTGYCFHSNKIKDTDTGEVYKSLTELSVKLGITKKITKRIVTSKNSRYSVIEINNTGSRKIKSM